MPGLVRGLAGWLAGWRAGLRSADPTAQEGTIAFRSVHIDLLAEPQSAPLCDLVCSPQHSRYAPLPRGGRSGDRSHTPMSNQSLARKQNKICAPCSLYILAVGGSALPRCDVHYQVIIQWSEGEVPRREAMLRRCNPLCNPLYFSPAKARGRCLLIPP